jgi:hypothetical protein
LATKFHPDREGKCGIARAFHARGLAAAGEDRSSTFRDIFAELLRLLAATLKPCAAGQSDTVGTLMQRTLKPALPS